MEDKIKIQKIKLGLSIGVLGIVSTITAYLITLLVSKINIVTEQNKFVITYLINAISIYVIGYGSIKLLLKNTENVEKKEKKKLNDNNGEIITINNNKYYKYSSDKNIIRNKLKIKASINNAKVFMDIESEFGSFKNYLLGYFKEYPVKEVGKTTSSISDELSKDLYKRGMRFVGSTIIYSYLQAIGLINSHDENCDVKM